MTAPPPPARRFHFIDLLRGWAVIVMVETHAVNAYMDFTIRSQGWFWYLNFLNGLVAPSFIFISGFALRIVTDRKWDHYISFTPVFRRQLRRLLFIVAVAYAMHLPFALLKDWTVTMPDGWRPFFVVDVLHAIALSLIALQFLVLLLKRQERVVIAAAGIGCAFAFLTPFVWQADFTRPLGLFIGNYFNNRQGSLFPLFPWAAFAFFGYTVAHFFMRAHKAGKESVFILRLAGLSAAGAAAAMGLYALPVRIFPETTFWLTSPSWLFTRTAMVCFLLAAMWYYEHGISAGRFSIVGAFGQQSLLVYTMHLAMIYGTFGLPKLSYDNYHHLSIWLALATAALILAVMFILVQWWNRPRAERKARWKILAAGALLWGAAAMGWEPIVDRLEPAVSTASRLVVAVMQAL